MTTNQRDHVPNHKASQLFAGGGEIGALMQAMDWAETPLGPVEFWPQSLQTAVGICLASRFPMLLWWGPELIMLYNEAYRPMLGTTKHPQALGHRGRDCWSEIWDIIGPMLEGVVRTGIATHLEFARLRRETDARAHELAAILETMDDAVLLIGPDGKIIRTNPAYFRLLQIEHSAEWQATFLQATIAERNVLMRTADPTGHPLAAEAWPGARLLRGETFIGSQAQEYRIIGMAGQHKVLSVSGVPLRDTQGQVQGGIEVLHDLTARYEQEQERAQMLNVVAHELRSPLTSLKMGIDINLRSLARGKPVGLDRLQHNAQSVQRMERLVNDLLGAARAETAQVEFQREPTDLAVLCKQTASEQMAASGRKIDLELPEEPVIAEVDRGRIGQVVENLLSNALKYSATEATVALQLRQEVGDALISVQDSGPGIPADVQPRLFERFYRAPGAKVLHGAGVGLGVGLYLSKLLVERHGGTISVASEFGHGTIFTVRLPLTS